MFVVKAPRAGGAETVVAVEPAAAMAWRRGNKGTKNTVNSFRATTDLLRERTYETSFQVFPDSGLIALRGSRLSEAHNIEVGPLMFPLFQLWRSPEP